ncbi:DUF6602 domain-containing protein [Vibrio harveyi]|uniref:DUF6602 domain-containing protein n=1 Tax=Vibrio harveyi TaxID=669 RepID=UPI003752C53A
MSALFKEKLENLHSSLMSAHNDTAGYTSPVLGSEREIVTKKLLSHILPPSYRIGSGAIIDQKGRKTGHIDAVIEQPYSLSFPIASDANRLYVAAAVGATFEIKSNLYSQRDEALNKVKEIKNIHRYISVDKELVIYDELKIPTFIVSFKGHKTIKGIQDRFFSFDGSLVSPDGVFVIESEVFYGRSSAGSWYEAKGKAESMLAFISCVTESLRKSHEHKFDLFNYKDLL